MSRSHQPLLRRFVGGLARQIPPGRLRAMASSSPAARDVRDVHESDGSAGDGGALRLFLEKAAESLPMGSRVRSAVGEDFEGALELLREEIEGRVERESGGDGPAAGGGGVVEAAGEEQKEQNEGRYPFMVFSQGQHDHARMTALQNDDDEKLRLLLCSPHATPSDFLGDISSASDAGAALKSLRSALLSGKGDDDSLEYGEVLANFVEILSSKGDDPSALSSIRQLLSCLATLDTILDNAASDVGELVGLYARLSFAHSAKEERGGDDAARKTSNMVVNAIAVALASFSDDSADAAAIFVRGYLRGMSRKGEATSVTNSTAAGALSSLAAALRANGKLKDGLPVFPKVNKSSSKVEKAQLRVWRGWADGILGPEEENGEALAVEVNEENAEEVAEEVVEQKKEAGHSAEKTGGTLPTLPEGRELEGTELVGETNAQSAAGEDAPIGKSTRKRKGSDAGDSAMGTPRRSSRQKGSEPDAGDSGMGTPRRSTRARTNSDSDASSLASDGPRRSSRKKRSNAN